MAFFSKLWKCQYCYTDAPCGRWQSVWKKSLTAITQECYNLYWTSPGWNTPQNSSCTATYHPSRKPSKLDEPDMQDTSWRSKDELISDVLLWTPSHGRAKVGRPSRTYLLHLCADTRCSLEDLQEAMDDRDEWRERVREIRASSTTRWWC